MNSYNEYRFGNDHIKHIKQPNGNILITTAIRKKHDQLKGQYINKLKENTKDIGKSYPIIKDNIQFIGYKQMTILNELQSQSIQEKYHKELKSKSKSKHQTSIKNSLNQMLKH
jgi:hypothetical protein